MRHTLIVMSLLAGLCASARAETSISLELAVPGLTLGINLPQHPTLVRVPGVPVYCAPRRAEPRPDLGPDRGPDKTRGNDKSRGRGNSDGGNERGPDRRP